MPIIVEKSLRDISIASPINSLNIDLMEIFTLKHLGLKHCIPWLPVGLFQVDIVIEYSVCGREHRLNVTNDNI